MSVGFFLFSFLRDAYPKVLKSYSWLCAQHHSLPYSQAHIKLDAGTMGAATPALSIGLKYFISLSFLNHVIILFCVIKDLLSEWGAAMEIGVGRENNESCMSVVHHEWSHSQPGDVEC